MFLHAAELRGASVDRCGQRCAHRCRRARAFVRALIAENWIVMPKRYELIVFDWNRTAELRRWLRETPDLPQRRAVDSGDGVRFEVIKAI
jgi:hypothetical protein